MDGDPISSFPDYSSGKYSVDINCSNDNAKVQYKPVKVRLDDDSYRYEWKLTVEKIKGNPEADTIDVYEAMDMFLPGLFGYFSILDGGLPKEIPNLRNKEERDIWRNNTACTDPKVAGDMLLPTTVNGTPEIDDAVYEKMAQLWDEDCKSENSRRSRIFTTGIVDK